MPVDELLDRAKKAISLGAIRGFARYASDRGYSYITRINAGDYPYDYGDFVDDNIPIMTEAMEDAADCFSSPLPVDKYVGAMYECGMSWLDDEHACAVTHAFLEMERLTNELAAVRKRYRDLTVLHDRVWCAMHVAAGHIRSAAEEFHDMDIDALADWVETTKDLLEQSGFSRDGTPLNSGTYSVDTDAIIDKQKARMDK